MTVVAQTPCEQRLMVCPVSLMALSHGKGACQSRMVNKQPGWASLRQGLRRSRTFFGNFVDSLKDEHHLSAVMKRI